MIDLNDALPETDLTFVIPEGTYHVRCKVITGGYGDDESLTISVSQYTLFLKIHFVITQGKYEGATIYDQINVELAGAKLPPNKEDNYKRAIQMGRSRVRSIVEGAREIDRDDDSKAARAKRILRGGWGDIDGLECQVRVGIRPAKDQYPERNEIRSIVHPSDGDDLNDDLPDFRN